MTNETDRELLELAAKAVGHDVIMTQPFIGLQIVDGNLWNPLTEDGDALRLACVLSLMVDAHHERAISGDRYCDGRRDWVYSDGSTFGIAAIRRPSSAPPQK